jgi:hypothetical protein
MEIFALFMTGSVKNLSDSYMVLWKVDGSERTGRYVKFPAIWNKRC